MSSPVELNSHGNGVRLLTLGTIQIAAQSHSYISPLDACGLRSLAQAFVIRELLRRIKHDTGATVNLKVSDYFDMIGGSGFGG
jgi:hypothetical protein